MTEEQVIREVASKSLLQEIEDLVETAEEEEWEGMTTMRDMLEHISDLAEENEDRKTLKDCRKVMIALGDFEEISAERAKENKANSLGYKGYAFKMDGKYFDSVR